MVTIDGSFGEGGGQILRTAASLAALTGQEVRVERIRAGRVEPGLKAQHLTAIEAAMRLCGGGLNGGVRGSTEVEMIPGHAIRAGSYEFDVATAGSTVLVLQTVLVPLLLADGSSEVTVVGGTHNDHAPSSDYFRDVFLPALGLAVAAEVEKVGFYPRGGGKVRASIRPAPIQAIRWPRRSEAERLRGVVTASEGLPAHILSRAEAELLRRAEASNRSLDVVLSSVSTLSAGMAIHLEVRYGQGTGGFTALGRRGLPTERVVENAWREFEAFEETDASVDEHLADQLVLPMLFADGPSEYRTSRVTEHLTTLAWLVPQFGVGRVAVDRGTGHVRVEPTASARTTVP